MYIRQYEPGTISQLERYEHLRAETGLLGEALHRAWDALMQGLASPSGKARKPEPPPPKYARVDHAIDERIHKLRAKANDPAVSWAEARAFHAKADELLRKQMEA